jgi:hypothetical protein
MEDYPGLSQAGDAQRQHMGQTGHSQGPSRTEDQFTKSVESYTAEIPSSAYLGIAVGAMALSLLFQATGQGKWGNFIAQWVPTWLIIGVYNKLVKLEGHDWSDRGTDYSSRSFSS